MSYVSRLLDPRRLGNSRFGTLSAGHTLNMDLCLPLCNDCHDTFLYLGPPVSPSCVLLWEPSRKFHSMHQDLQSLLVECLRESARHHDHWSVSLNRELRGWQMGDTDKKKNLSRALTVVRKRLVCRIVSLNSRSCHPALFLPKAASEIRHFCR